MNYCKRCGNKLDENVRFCSTCGTTIDSFKLRSGSYNGIADMHHENFSIVKDKCLLIIAVVMLITIASVFAIVCNGKTSVEEVYYGDSVKPRWNYIMMEPAAKS